MTSSKLKQKLSENKQALIEMLSDDFPVEFIFEGEYILIYDADHLNNLIS